MANVETLIEQLTTGDYYERSSAARGLGASADPRAKDALVGALGDEDDWVLEYAAESLGRLGDPSVAPALVPLLDHRQYKVRTAAAAALGALGNADVLPDLQRYADDGDSWVREAVREAIGAIESGAPATPNYAAPATTAAPAAPAGDPDELVPAAARAVGAQHKPLGDGSHLVRMTLNNARHQKVRIVTNETSSSGQGRIRLLTVIGPATRKHVTWAMRQNLRITRGALGLLRLRGRDHLAMTETLFTADATVELLAEAIQRLARRGDRLERSLTDVDAW